MRSGINEGGWGVWYKESSTVYIYVQKGIYLREKYKIYKNTCSSLFIQKLSKESVTINGCIFDFLNYFSSKKVIDYLTSDNDFGMES